MEEETRTENGLGQKLGYFDFFDLDKMSFLALNFIRIAKFDPRAGLGLWSLKVLGTYKRPAKVLYGAFVVGQDLMPQKNALFLRSFWAVILF